MTRLMGHLVRQVVDFVRARLVPALLTAVGVSLIAAGLLSYTGPVVAGPEPSGPDASASGGSPTATPTSGLPTPLITLPAESPSPDSSAAAANRLATRIVIPALGIDLPVIAQPDPTYPACNVAMYATGIPGFGQPGQGKVVYIYAHARTGMFLPLLDQSQVNDGQRMIGMLVQVFTNDDQLFLYEINEVRRHVPANSDLSLLTKQANGKEVLWLQTSEGPNHTYPKLQVRAVPLSAGPADHAQANPTPHPLACT